LFCLLSLSLRREGGGPPGAFPCALFKGFSCRFSDEARKFVPLKARELFAQSLGRLRERESLDVFSGAHDSSTGGTIFDHPFSTQPFGGTPFRCRHSPASAFLCHVVPFVADVSLFTDTYQSLLDVVLSPRPLPRLVSRLENQ
jgi:hypothetical protein